MHNFLTVVASIIYNVASLGGGLCSFGATYQPPKPYSLRKTSTTKNKMLW